MLAAAVFFVLFPGFLLAMGLLNARESRSDPQQLQCRFTKAYGLTLGPDLSPWAGGLLQRRNARYHWGTAVGGAIASEMMGVLHVLHVHRPPPFGMIGFAVCMWAGGPVAVAIGDLWRIRAASAKAQPRVAHARSITVTDYLNPVEAAAFRGFAVLPLVLTCASPLIPRGGTDPPDARWAGFGPMLAASLLVLASLVAAEMAQRLIVSHRQHATTGSALEFEDALRAQTLRMIAMPPAALGYAVTAEIAEGLASTTASAAMAGLLDSVWLTLGVAFAGGYALVVWRLHPEKRYRRRLWTTDDRS